MDGHGWQLAGALPASVSGQDRTGVVSTQEQRYSSGNKTDIHTCGRGADQQGWRGATDLKRSDKACLTRQVLKNNARECGHDKVGNKEPSNTSEQ